jgi:sterol desaturase/sphingolipid hydroxylase (fatty acid hydroxylase superfamily)
MAWWNGPVLIAVGSLPFVAASSLSGHWGILVGGAISCAAYYGCYEYIHWCMHLPKQRKLEKLGIFSFLNGHHVLHHRYMHKNFNVVFPLWDMMLGTLMLRSKLKFPQPSWPVPNLQPLV